MGAQGCATVGTVLKGIGEGGIEGARRSREAQNCYANKDLATGDYFIHCY